MSLLSWVAFYCCSLVFPTIWFVQLKLKFFALGFLMILSKVNFVALSLLPQSSSHWARMTWCVQSSDLQFWGWCQFVLSFWGLWCSAHFSIFFLLFVSWVHLVYSLTWRFSLFLHYTVLFQMLLLLEWKLIHAICAWRF